MSQRNRRSKHLDTIRNLEQERAALDLIRYEMLSTRQIAERLGIGVSTAHKRIHDALGRLAPIPEAEEHRARLGEQLEGQLEVAIAVQRAAIQAERPNLDVALKAGGQIVKVTERLAKLHGLDAPVKHDVTVTDKITAEIESLVEILAGTDTATTE